MTSIHVDNLTFKYDDNVIFKDLTLEICANNCYVLAGLNGCGKSTLLKVIGGKTLADFDRVKVLGKDPFRDTSLNRDLTFVNNHWGTQTVAYSGYNMPLQSSLRVKEMMQAIKLEYPERNSELIDILDINPEWRLNSVSEGQRKRVQLYLTLIKPFQVCLLDEITVNLDLLVKDKFMHYLKKETQERKCCVIYVTHIFDGLEDWATKLLYMRTDRKIETKDVSGIPSLYKYLLKRFKDEVSEGGGGVEEEDGVRSQSSRNAGGFSHGVLCGVLDPFSREDKL